MAVVFVLSLLGSIWLAVITVMHADTVAKELNAHKDIALKSNRVEQFIEETLFLRDTLGALGFQGSQIAKLNNILIETYFVLRLKEAHADIPQDMVRLTTMLSRIDFFWIMFALRGQFFLYTVGLFGLALGSAIILVGLDNRPETAAPQVQ